MDNPPQALSVMIAFKLFDYSDVLATTDCVLDRTKNSINILLAIHHEQKNAPKYRESANEEKLKRGALSIQREDPLNWPIA